MLAIETKYLGPTNFRGARVRAKAVDGQSATIAWDHALGTLDNHAAAARLLANRLHLAGDWHGGETARGYVFVKAIHPDFTVLRITGEE